MFDETTKHEIMDRVSDLLWSSEVRVRFEGAGDSDRVYLLDEGVEGKFVIVEDGIRVIINSEYDYINRNFPLNPEIRVSGVLEDLDETARNIVSDMLREVSILEGKSLGLDDIKYSDNIIVYIGDRYDIRENEFIYSLFVGKII